VPINKYLLTIQENLDSPSLGYILDLQSSMMPPSSEYLLGRALDANSKKPPPPPKCGQLFTNRHGDKSEKTCTQIKFSSRSKNPLSFPGYIINVRLYVRVC